LQVADHKRQGRWPRGVRHRDSCGEAQATLPVPVERPAAGAADGLCATSLGGVKNFRRAKRVRGAISAQLADRSSPIAARR
jgi:hypothetical protein